MSHKLTIDNTNISFDLRTETPIDVQTPQVMPLIRMATELYKVTPCKSVEARRRSQDGDINYVITTTDERVWTQRLHRLGDGYVMTVDAPQFWDFHEFQHIREVRDQLMEIDRVYSLNRLTLTWL